MGMFDKLIANLRASRKTIVFTEGVDPRIQSAAERLLKEDLMDVILCGNPAEVKAAAEKGGFDVAKATVMDPAAYPEMDAMVAEMAALRKGKMTEDECRAALKKSNYFGTMLVKMGKADALLGGATYSTADTVRPALQIIKTRKGSNLVSSSFVLYREKDGKKSPVAGWYTCDEAVNAHLKAGIPAEKLVLGMPFYGHGNNTYGSFVYYCDIKGPKGSDTEKWDDVGQVPYYANASGTLTLGFDNVRSIEAKCQYVLDKGLRGGMYWEYCYDNSSLDLTKAVARKLL